MRGGQLRERFAFQERFAQSDGHGNTRDEWHTQFVAAARRMMLRGGETVTAARLQGTQPAVLTIRSSSQSRRVAAHWRAVDERTGDIWNIRAVTPDERRDHIDLLAELGNQA